MAADHSVPNHPARRLDRAGIGHVSASQESGHRESLPRRRRKTRTLVMNTDLIGFVLRKMRVPTTTKVGLLGAYIVFKVFDVEGRVNRALKSDPVT